MSFLDNLISGPVIEALGWTLVHSIWQGAILALLVAGIMIFLRKGSARTRYLVYLSSLLIMLGLSTMTFFKVYNPVPASERASRASHMVLASVTSINEPVAKQAPDKTWFQSAQKSFADYFERNFPLFVSLWFLGICLFMLKFLGAYAYTHRLKHYRTLEVSEFWERKVLILSQKIGLNHKVNLLESALAKVPMVVGYFKPVILVPLGMLGNLTPQQVEAILIHELAHIYRKDYLINILQTFIDIIFFYHPAIWWISRSIRMEREHVCDDIVISVSDDHLEYARALASLQHLSQSAQLPAPALAGNKYHLLNRIQRMMNKPRTIPSFTEGFMSALIIIAGIAGMSATAAISFGTDDFPKFISEPEPVKELVTERVEPAAVDPMPLIKPDTISKARRDSIEFLVQEEMTRAMEELEAAMEARERALEAYREAMEARGIARDEIKDKIRQEYMQNMQQHMESLREYLEQIEKTMPEDSLQWVPYGSGNVMPFIFGHNFDFDHDFDHDFDFGDFEELEELEEIWELEELEELEELKEIHEHEAWHHLELPPRPENYVYHYRHPEKSSWHHYSDRTSNIIIKELRRDRLIGWEGDQVIEIDSSGLYINGEKQSRDKYKKYKRLYESLENEKITGDNPYKLIL